MVQEERIPPVNVSCVKTKRNETDLDSSTLH